MFLNTKEIKKQENLLLIIVVVVCCCCFISITANDKIDEPVVCIVLKHSPDDQFHNLMVPSYEPLTNVCEFNKSTDQ